MGLIFIFVAGAAGIAVGYTCGSIWPRGEKLKFGIAVATALSLLLLLQPTAFKCWLPPLSFIVSSVGFGLAAAALSSAGWALSAKRAPATAISAAALVVGLPIAFAILVFANFGDCLPTISAD